MDIMGTGWSISQVPWPSKNELKVRTLGIRCQTLKGIPVFHYQEKDLRLRKIMLWRELGKLTLRAMNERSPTKRRHGSPPPRGPRGVNNNIYFLKKYNC